MADSPHVIAVSAANFVSIVIDGSRQRPVLVDFWADWCAPCRQLMPLLARLADEYGGQFLLAKVDTDREQELAMQFGIRSLPTVQLFKDGQIIDQFMGALPEAEIRAFLDRHLPREGDRLLHEARRRLDAGNLAAAEALVEQVRTLDPEHRRLFLAEARLALAKGELASAHELLEHTPVDLVEDAEVALLRGQMHFAALLDAAPELDALEARLREAPEDSRARLWLAARQVMAGRHEAAMEQLLTLLQRDRQFGDDAARKTMLMVFELLGNQGELVSRYRARMSRLLY